MIKATISLLHSNNLIQSIECEKNAALYEMGWMLYTEYQDIEKIKKLISLGNLIKLKKNIDIPEGVEHSYYYEQKDICVFKERDAMKISPSVFFPSLTKYTETMGQNIHKHYLFDEKENQWKFLNPTSLQLHSLNTSILTSYELNHVQRVKLEQDIYEKNVLDERNKIDNQLPIKTNHKKGIKI